MHANQVLFHSSPCQVMGYATLKGAKSIASMVQCVMCSTAALSTGYLLHICSFVLTLVSRCVPVCLIICICVMWICDDVGFSDIVCTCIAGNYHRAVM